MFHEISTNMGLLCYFCYGVMIVVRFLIELQGVIKRMKISYFPFFLPEISLSDESDEI